MWLLPEVGEEVPEEKRQLLSLILNLLLNLKDQLLQRNQLLVQEGLEETKLWRKLKNQNKQILIIRKSTRFQKKSQNLNLNQKSSMK